MKRYSLNTWILVILMISISSLQAQRKPKIKGNRDVIEVQEELPAFHSIVLEDNLEIAISRSESPGYSITADDNLIDILKFQVEDSTLTISSFYIITGKKELNINVQYTSLNKIVLNDGVLETNELLSSDKVQLEVSGYARFKGDIRAGEMKVSIGDNGKGELNVQADSLNLSLRGKADAVVFQDGVSTTVEMEESARLSLEGVCEQSEIEVSGDSKLRAEKMETATTTLVIKGTASAHINTYRDFALTSSDKGKTYLYGDPTIKIESFLHTSELYKREQQ